MLSHFKSGVAIELVCRPFLCFLFLAFYRALIQNGTTSSCEMCFAPNQTRLESKHVSNLAWGVSTPFSLISFRCTEPFPECKAGVEVMGYSVRVERWRYTCWFAMDRASVTVNTEQIIGQELYDFVGFDGSFDFSGMNFNVANASANVLQMRVW